jgi:Zn-dependent membrane protease YugP
MIPGLILGIYAQFRLMAAYNKYLSVRNESGLSGAEVARAILDRAGLDAVPVGEVGGRLTDHYDPLQKRLMLSSENFHGRSISAIGVAAHETGHALQQQAAYAPLEFRMALYPITHFASLAWMGIIALSFIMPVFGKLLWVAIAIFAVLTLFQLVTLPVEYDASRRAKARLLQLGLIGPHESGAVNSVLNAAALTYVAAMITSVLQLVRLLMMARDRN